MRPDPSLIPVQSNADHKLSLLEPDRDGITGYEDVETIVSTADLLANDTPKEVPLGDTLSGFAGNNLTVTGLTNFRHGSGHLDANKMVHFNPEANYFGSDAGFDYSVKAVNGQTGTASVGITLQNVNDAPTAANGVWGKGGVMAMGWKAKSKRKPKPGPSMWCGFIRLVWPVTLVIALGGCAIGDAVVGASISAANQADSALLRSRGQSLLAKQLQRIEELRAKGDPLGDYLWVVANSEGWVDKPELDPIKRLEMYRTASEKGSTDALVAMGVYLFTGSPTPNATGIGSPLPDEKMDMKKGLELIEQGTRERCWYWEPIIQTLHHQNCLRPIIAADKIWPKFRDGFLWPKDAALMSYWKAKSAQCEQDPAYRRAYAFCN